MGFVSREPEDDEPEIVAGKPPESPDGEDRPIMFSVEPRSGDSGLGDDGLSPPERVLDARKRASSGGGFW